MKVANGVPTEFKNPTLRRWRVKEVVSLNGVRSRHVYGHDITNDTGRASSAIEKFDRTSMTAITRSGRKYKLLGAPGNTRSGELAWENWCLKSIIVAEEDVSIEYFSVDKLFSKLTRDKETPTQLTVSNALKLKNSLLKNAPIHPLPIHSKSELKGLKKMKTTAGIYTDRFKVIKIASSEVIKMLQILKRFAEISINPAKSDLHQKEIGGHTMTYRFSRRLAILQFTAAFAMLIALYVNEEPRFWGWMLFLPFFSFVVLQAVRTYRYSLTITGESITLVDIEKSGKYPVADIAAVNVWPAKGDRIAVITFADRRKLSFPSHLQGFDSLVESLKNQAVQPKLNLEAS